MTQTQTSSARTSASPSAVDDLRINISRLSREIFELSEIGRKPDHHGTYRVAFSEADMQARAWMQEKISAAGLTPRMDGAGNVFGHWEYPSKRPAVLVGSHLDTVPASGPLDGALGVLGALEVARTIREAGIEPKFPLDIVGFSDEEGRFGAMFGVEAFCGLQTLETIESLRDIEGVPLMDAMRQAGLDPLKALDCQRLSNPLRAYLELHVEQGPVLESQRIAIGIVSVITGLFKWKARLIGKANHAGTTPMNLRRDAFMGLADFAHELPRILEENGSEISRATIGRVDIFPGHAHTIPEAAEFSLVVRDAEQATLDELEDAIRKALSAVARRRGLMFEFEPLSNIVPQDCDPEVRQIIERQANRLGLSHLHMPSGAGHDAQFLTQVAPTGMIFVPSRGGISHAPQEWTDLADIEKGVNLLLASTLQLMTDEGCLSR